MNESIAQSLLASLQHPALRDATDTLLLVLDGEGRIVLFNRACELSTGYRQADLLGQPFRTLIARNQWENVRRALAVLPDDTPGTHLATTWIGKDGHERYIQWSACLLEAAAGEARRIIITGIDITGYRETLRSRLDADSRYRALVETSAEVIWEFDTDAVYRYVSPRVTDVLGYAPHEVIGRSLYAFVSPAEAERLRPLMAELFRRRAPFQHFINHRRHKDGREVILSCSGVPFFDNRGELLGYRGMSRDVTELQRAEARLRESEERLRLSLDLAGIGAWDWHLPSGRLYWSDNVWRLLGHEPGDLVPDYATFLACVHPEDRAEVEAAVARCLETGEPYDVEHRVVRPDGTVHWVRGVGNLQRRDGKPERMLGVFMSVDGRKRAERQLQASERKYRFLVDNAADAIALIDETATVVEVNRQACLLFGHSREEMIGQLAFNFSHPARRERQLELFHQVLQSGGPVTEETWVRNRNGLDVPVEMRATRLHLDEGNLVQIIIRDVTERREREAARLARERRQRDALVREVHHRIKNNLQGILGLLRNQAFGNPALTAGLEKIIQQVQSIALIHGIHGQRADGALLLCELLPALLRSMPGYPQGHRGHELAREQDHALAIREEEGVAVALILGELLANAAKHARDFSRPVAVHLRAAHGQGEIRITSPGARLPDGFDFASGRQCHTGLELVKALMPREGLELAHRQTETGVLTLLGLRAPLVQAAPLDAGHPPPHGNDNPTETLTGDAQ